MLEFIRAELDDVKRERDYYRDLLFQHTGVIRPVIVAQVQGQEGKKMIPAPAIKSRQAIRQRLEAEDKAMYLAKIRQLEMETLARQVGLKTEESDGSTH